MGPSHRRSAPGPALGAAGLGGVAPVGFVEAPNDRPEGPAQQSIPPTLTVRADFHAALPTALAAIRAKGCAARCARPAAASRLAAGATATPLDEVAVLGALGRLLEVFPLRARYRPGSRSSRDRQARDAGDEPVSAGRARARRRGSGAGTEPGRQARLSHERRGRCPRRDACSRWHRS